MTVKAFQKAIRSHYKKHKRAMPWRETRDPYKILVSEVMLQQTQVSRVMVFYPIFVKRFPDFRALARARQSDVLHAWQGLGYNRRALALQNLSRIVLEKFNGTLPRERNALESLPGIGKATAGSLRAFVWDEPEVFIETNIRRVFAYFFLTQSTKNGVRKMKVTDAAIERYIKRTLPRKQVREWYWALMDYGTMLRAHRIGSAHRRKQSRFTGSDRELRGKVLRILLKKRKMSARGLASEVNEPVSRVEKIVSALFREGFIKKGRTSAEKFQVFVLR